ncbi:MAG: methionine biosynthesis protein MetW [Alphaproteobacteria bacterium]|nr:methionine biosynthesis protein MetW [Alphaproteobacteria bacterium]
MNDPVIRDDIQQCIDWVPRGARVLDVGCSDGELMALLRTHKQVRVQGIELDPDKVNACIGRGLAVIQGDANIDLLDYPDQAFDVVVLSQTLQAMLHPRETLRQLGRIAPRAIVSTPNFAYWRGVMQLLFAGRMPVTKHLPVTWYETANIHLCTITDFLELAALESFTICDGTCFDADVRARPWNITGLGARLLATQASFLLEKRLSPL